MTATKSLPLFLWLIFLTLVISPAFAAQITTTVDRNPVNIDESFKILFTASDTPDGEPDFTPLQQDFSILNQGQSSNSSWVNGQYSKTIVWSLEVTAKKSGNQVIPAILFGNDSSEPLPIKVIQVATKNDTHTIQTNEEIYLEVSANPEQPYVQSQVIYTIRLYRRVDVAQAELSEPEAPDAVIEKLGEDSNFNTVVNGVSYLVTERKYAIFPQKSGTITIKPLTLTAAVILDREPDFRDFFGSRMTKTKRVLSKEVTLNVKPVPSSFKGKDWLAAENIELTQDWSGDIQQMKVGEPITRTLTLRGTGTTVGQLPELSPTQTDANFKAYPDQPVLKEQKLADGITASRQEKIAMIPSVAGQHKLPEVEIPWFNTKSQTMEIARLPETTFNVVGNGETQAETPPEPKTSAPPSTPLATPKVSARLPPDTVLNQQNIWLWTSLFLALGWLSTLIYFLGKRPKRQQADNRKKQGLSNDADIKESIKQLKEACSKNDVIKAKNALLSWGKQKFKAHNLEAVAAHCDPALRAEILTLSQVLYGKNSSEWLGKKLMHAFNDNKAVRKKTDPDEPALEPLHRL